MAFYNQGYPYQTPYQMNYPYGGQQFLQGQQDWALIQVPGVIRPYYVHTPTCYVYESPMITSMPLGLYSMQSGVLNLYNQQGGQYYGGYGAGYRSMPVETPYSATALALQGGRYPATSMAVTNEMAYPYYNSPYSMYGTYGQRGIMPGLIM